MLLTEQIQLKYSKELSKICQLAKNLYNKANYLIRHRYFFLLSPNRLDFKWLKELKSDLFSEPDLFSNIASITKKYLTKKENLIKRYKNPSGKQEYGGIGKFMYYTELWGLIKYCPEYKALPSQSAQQILFLLEKNWKSYFKKREAYYKAKKELPPVEFKKKFNTKPKIPKYKNKNGESIIIFTNQQCNIENGYLFFPRKSYKKDAPRWLPSIKTRLKNKMKQVRIIPQGIRYKLEIVYEKATKDLDLNKNRIGAIDLGVNNIVTLVNNIGKQPIIIKGGIIKSINQGYNKERSRLKSIKDKQKIKDETKKLKRIDLNRNNKIKDCFHKISRLIINYCIKNNIGTLAIGYNEGWKQNSNMGKENNQNFVSIPFLKLINQIQYKSELISNDVILVNEDYTSKCSFLDNETIGKHKKYVGKRISRGLYRSKNRIIINADVNSAYNILKKAFPNAISADGIEDVCVHPCSLTWIK